MIKNWISGAAGFVVPWYYRWAAIALLVLAACSVVWLKGAAHADAKHAEEMQAVVDDANKRSITLQSKFDERRKTDNETNARTIAERDSIIASLRTRPNRPSTPAPIGQAATGCDGTQLYRDDGEFLAREAGRAETIRNALKSCYAAYDDARGASGQ